MGYTTSHKLQLIDSIENQILYANIVCVLIGEEGQGKSYLLEKIKRKVNADVFISEVTAEQNLTPEQIEKTVCLQLGLSWQQSDKTLAEKISQNSERRTLLTVDDAHLLSKESLNYLLQNIQEQLESGQNHLFLLLTGEASLASKLNNTNTLNLNPNLCALFELNNFAEEETINLLADFQNSNTETIGTIFDEQKISYFYQLSTGNPGKLEYQASRWMNEAGEPKTHQKSAENKHQYFSAIGYGVIAVLLVLALIYQDKINQLINDKPDIETVVSNEQQLPASNITNTRKKSLAESLEQQKSAAPQNVENKNSQVKEEKLNIEEAINLEPTSSDINNKINSSDKAETQPLLGTEDNIESQPKSTQDITDTEPNKLNKTKNDNVAAEKTHLVEKQIVDKNQQNIKNSNSQHKSKNEQSQLFTEDEHYLLALNDKTFTLQWVGVSDLASAQAFRRNHPLASQMKIFKRRTTANPLFLVVSGNFNAKIDASNARDIYKQRNYQGSPWIKSVAAVKKEIQP